MTMLPITYGYARVGKADDDSKNLDTQILELQRHGIREDLIFTDVASGRTMNRTGWLDLMSRLQTGDTLVVAFLDRLSRSFEDGVRIQAELTQRDIAIVALRENIDTREPSAAARFFRRSMLAQGAYQVDSGPASGSSWAWTGPGRRGSAWGDRRRCLLTRWSSPAGWRRKGLDCGRSPG